MSKNQEDWPKIRMEMLKELLDKEFMYKEVYGSKFDIVRVGLNWCSGTARTI